MEGSRCLCAWQDSTSERVFLAGMFSMMPVRELGFFEPLSLNWVMFAISSNEYGNDLFWDLGYIIIKSLAYSWSLLILKLFPEFSLQIRSLHFQ